MTCIAKEHRPAAKPGVKDLFFDHHFGDQLPGRKVEQIAQLHVIADATGDRKVVDIVAHCDGGLGAPV